MNNFIGNSGKYYAFNPFGGEKYTFAVYPNAECYKQRRCLPLEYLPSSGAFDDYKEDDEIPGYEFTIITNGKKEILKTDIDGNIEGKNEQMKKYLSSLYAVHGKGNVTFKYKKVA